MEQRHEGQPVAPDDGHPASGYEKTQFPPDAFVDRDEPDGEQPRPLEGLNG